MGCLSDYLAHYLAIFLFRFNRLRGSDPAAVPSVGCGAWSTPRAERGQQRRLTPVAEYDGAGIPCPFRPAEFLDSCQQRSHERTCQVMPALAPIETCPAKRPP